MTWHQADLAMIRGEGVTRPGTDPRSPVTLRYRGNFLEHHDGFGWVPCSYRRDDRDDRNATDWQILRGTFFDFAPEFHTRHHRLDEQWRDPEEDAKAGCL